MKTLLKMSGIVACVVALGLNLQNALDGYGIKSGNLFLNVFATGSESSESTESSSALCFTKTSSGTSEYQDCEIVLPDSTKTIIKKIKKIEDVYKCQGYNSYVPCYNGSVIKIYSCDGTYSTNDNTTRTQCPKSL